MSRECTRRNVLGSIGAVAATAALAGCSGGDGGGDGGDGGGTPPSVDAPQEVKDYVDSDNFDGTMADLTGQDAVSVEVGAKGNGGNFAFAPAAIQIDTGTTVTWEWTGKGSAHNVVSEDGPFDSGSAVTGDDVTYEYTFESSGTYLYYCGPHKTLGMKGAVVVK